MKKIYFMLFLLALIFNPSQQAQARGGGQDWMLDIDLSYLSYKSEASVNGTTSSGESSTTYYDITLGYMLSSNLMVGGIYATKNYKDSSGATISTSTSANALGATLGYVFENGAYLNGTYFLSATDDQYKKGSGFGLDLGWRTFTSGSFFIGGKLSYRSLKYTENTAISGFESQTNTSTLPYLTFGFGF